MPEHVPPVLAPPWDHYLARIATSTATFWENRPYPGYARLQGPRTWERLIDLLEKKILPLLHDAPLSELERFLLFASAYLYETGWQVKDAPSLTPAQRYRESGQEILRRFAHPDGRNDFGLSALNSQSHWLTIEALARLCELVGDLVDGQDISLHNQPQHAGNQEPARLALLSTLLYLADLLLVPRGRDWYLRMVPSFSAQELADARLALDPYVAYVELTDHALTIRYSIHPNDVALQDRIRALFEEPLKRWWVRNWRWLVCTYHIQLLFQQAPPSMLPVQFESLSATCPALIPFLQTYHPPEITLPTSSQMEALKTTEECRKPGEQPAPDQKREIFIAFAQQDRESLKELKNQLNPLATQERVTIWDASQILGGTDREQAITDHLGAATIILLLVSAHFLASDEGKKLIKQALVRNAPPTVYVVPILLRPAYWQVLGLEALAPLPSNERPVSGWQDRQEAYFDIAIGIKRIIEEQKKFLIRKRRARQESNPQPSE
jgi:hypothetical protein